jgi:hypothetical protein
MGEARSMQTDILALALAWQKQSVFLTRLLEAISRSFIWNQGMNDDGTD